MWDTGMGPCTLFYPDVPKVLAHATDSPPWEHFSSWGSLALCKALHCQWRQHQPIPEPSHPPCWGSAHRGWLCSLPLCLEAFSSCCFMSLLAILL